MRTLREGEFVSMDNIQQKILKTFELEVHRIVEEEAKKAAENVEQKVRAMAGQIAVRVCQAVNFETIGQDIVIKVRINQ